PLPLARRTHQLLTEQAKKLDQPLLDALERKGFKLDFGEDGTGWQFKYLTRGGGYYFNVGCSDLIAEGKIGLAQFSDIAEFTARSFAQCRIYSKYLGLQIKASEVGLLRAALAEDAVPPRNLAEAIRRRLEPHGGVELDLPVREPPNRDTPRGQ